MNHFNVGHIPKFVRQFTEKVRASFSWVINFSVSKIQRFAPLHSLSLQDKSMRQSWESRFDSAIVTCMPHVVTDAKMALDIQQMSPLVVTTSALCIQSFINQFDT